MATQVHAMNSLVTVFVPTKHRLRQLRECLGALRAQTLREPWEVVVVDDGSPEPVERHT